MTLTQLSEAVDITIANLSILKSGKAKAIRFSTLEKSVKYLNVNQATWFLMCLKIETECLFLYNRDRKVWETGERYGGDAFSLKKWHEP